MGLFRIRHRGFRRLEVLIALAVLIAAAPRVFAGDFDFVVIGDTRPRLESANFSIFEGLIDRINIEKPVLVVNLGDLIYGYGRSKEKQWQRYLEAVKRLQVPYYQVPGNHDTFSRAARRAYVRHFSKCYQSFNHGGCHFLLLDNCEQTRWGYLGTRQLEWLKADLATNTCRPVFVFLHFPVWEPDRVKAQYYDFWRQTLHPLFRNSGVKAVFGGHRHCYGPTLELDGIRYFITGGGGAELLPDYRKSGGMHHFVRVKVAGENFDVRVVTSQGELSDMDADIMGGFRFAERHSSRIGIVRGTQDLRDGIPFSVEVENPYAGPLVATAAWRADSGTFLAEPASEHVQLAPRARSTMNFTLKALRNTVELHALPWLDFNIVGPGIHHRFKREVLFLDELAAPVTTARPELDALLPEWTNAPTLLTSHWRGLKINVQALHDRENLYLAVTVPRRTLEGQEQEAIPDDLVLGFAPRLSETEFGGDFIRLGFTQNRGQPEIKDRTPGRHARSLPSGLRAASRQEAKETTFELCLPLRLLPASKAGERHRFVLSISFPMPETGADQSSAADDTDVNSFSYQVRYGGDSLAPVYFVEMLLQQHP